MKNFEKVSLLLFSLLLIALCLGCSKTIWVNILCESKMNVGQQMSCFYANDNLYCGSPVVKPEDIERLKIMDKAVFAVRSEESHRSELEKQGESGTYSSRFATNPVDYSVWNCNKTGTSDPAVTCRLLKNPDPKRVEQELELARFEDSIVRPLTEKTLVNACGNPRTTKTDSISTTFVYPTTHPGVLAKARFDTSSRDSEPRLDEIETVDEKTDEFYVKGILWFPYSNDGDRITSIREYLPSLK